MSFEAQAKSPVLRAERYQTRAGRGSYDGPCKRAHEQCLILPLSHALTPLASQGLAGHGVRTIPKVELVLADLVQLHAASPAAADGGAGSLGSDGDDLFDDEAAEEDGFEAAAGILADAREALALEAGASLCVKPAAEGGSVGVMRVDGAADLRVYAAAVAQEWGHIPAELTPGARCALWLPCCWRGSACEQGAGTGARRGGWGGGGVGLWTSMAIICSHCMNCCLSGQVRRQHHSPTCSACRMVHLPALNLESQTDAAC
jgi:hypothetical protein